MGGQWENKPIASAVQKIAKECEEAGCSAWTITRIVKEISKEQAGGEKELRKKAMQLLSKLDPSAARVYSSFQKMMVRTSSQKIENFDRGNIIRSLLKETDVARGIAEKIGHEVEEKIKDLEISYISTPLIREMVNVKLLEYGHENIRSQYARLGPPVFDVKRKIQQGAYSNKDIMPEYNLLRAIPRKFGEMHLHSEIFIASLEDFSTKPIAICYEFQALESLNKTIFHNIKKMNRLSRLVSWPVNCASVNTAMLPFTGKRQLKKNIELFAGAFNAVFPNKTGVARNIGVNLFVPEGKGENIDRELVAASANLLLKESAGMQKANTKIALATDTKYRLKLVKKRLLSNVAILNCRDAQLMPLNGIAAEKNMCGLFGVNLAKAAAGNKEQQFFGNIENCLKAIKELAVLKKNILSKRDYLKANDINPKAMVDGVGIYGIGTAAIEITNSHKEKELVQFAEKTVSFVSKELKDQFLVVQLLNKAGVKRFEAENKKKEDRMLVESIISKSRQLQKAMQAKTIAANKKEINELLDNGARIIETSSLAD